MVQYASIQNNTVVIFQKNVLYCIETGGFVLIDRNLEQHHV